MIIDRAHIKWGVGTVLATVAVTGLYLANANPDVLDRWHVPRSLPSWLGPVPPTSASFGATPLGLIYGTVALLIFLFAALLGARRNHPRWPGGKIKTWLRAHIWLTIFTIPLVIFHCGYHGGGPMTQVLLWLYAFVMVSGFWGLFLQNIVPRLMRAQLPEEVIFEQIPFVRAQLISNAEALRQDFADDQEVAETAGHDSEGGTATRAAVRSTATAAVIKFIDDEALPFLKSEGPQRSTLRTLPSAENQFRLLRLQVPDLMHTRMGKLQDICEEKRRLDLQVRLHYLLHGWLIFHAPASLVLIVLTIVHAVVAGFLYT